MNVSLYVALRTWFRTTDSADRLRGLGILFVLVCVLVAGGAGLGALVHPRVVTKTITDKQVVLTTEYKAQVVEKEAEVKWRTRVVTKVVYAPSSDKVAEVITEKSEAGDSVTTDTTATTDAKSASTTNEHAETETKPAAQLPRFAASLGLGLPPLRLASGTTLLGTFDVRPFQFLPLTLGLWGTVPLKDPGGTVVGAKAGVQW